jgi:Ca-activated chloride channel family protein
MHRLSGSRSIVSALIALFFLSDFAGAQEPVFRTTAERVTVAVVARNRDGRPVPGLLSRDFELFDDGQSREILDFRNDAGPISLAFLLDSSGSMHIGGKLERAREVAHFVLGSMDEGTDEAALFVFDKRVRPIQPFTSDFPKIKASFASIHPWGVTSLYDAIAETAQQLAQRPGRRAIVVLTDGVDTSSRMTSQEVSGIASSIDMPVYVVAVDTAAIKTGDLSNLAQWSGGTFYGISRTADSSLIARQVINELRHQYLLAFEPSSSAGWHRIEVRSRQRVALQSRSGYWTGRPEIGR